MRASDTHVVLVEKYSLLSETHEMYNSSHLCSKRCQNICPSATNLLGLLLIEHVHCALPCALA